MENKQNIEEKNTEGKVKVETLKYTLDDINQILRILDNVSVKGIANYQNMAQAVSILQNNHIREDK